MIDYEHTKTRCHNNSLNLYSNQDPIYFQIRNKMSSPIPPEQNFDPQPHQNPTQNFEPLPEKLDHHPEYLDKRASNTVLYYHTHFNHFIN